MGQNGKRKKGKAAKPADKKATNGAGGSSVPPPPDEAAATEAKEPSSEPTESAAPEAAAREAEPEGAPEAAPASGAKVEAPATPAAAWGEPIVRFEKRWTALESKLLLGVLAAQIVALVAWVLLKGISQPVTPEDSSGRVFRAALGIAIVGGVAARFSRKLAPSQRRAATGGAMLLGGLAGWMMGGSGGAYFDNVKGWFQEASLLTLMGGLRGVATRFTLWLALLGGSLATAAGKHIHIDLVFRFLPKKRRRHAAVVNYCTAALVCWLAVWGFFDHISQTLGAKPDATAGAKVGHTIEQIDHRLFLARKQIGLDFKSIPRVLAGDRYDTWMTGAAWNEWLKDAGFEDRYKPEDVKNLLVAPDVVHAPLVVSPDGESTRGLLVDVLSLVFPFGLFAIGLRFLLRALLTLSGHLSADPDEVHREDLKSAQTPRAPEEGSV